MKFLVIALLMTSTVNQANANECVILLHGMARSEQSMSKMAKELSKQGYSVVNYGYPSTSMPIERIAEEHLPIALEQCGKADQIHFVTHSLGGIVVRQYLSQNHIGNLGKVVMLGPPNSGSEVVDKLKNVPGFKLINGPAGLQLGTEANSVPNSLGPVDYPVGVIAGNRSINLMLSSMLPEQDDGKVTVESTKLAGMKDHIVMPVTHTFMMRNKKVIKQVIAFLKAGKFNQT